MPTERKDVIYLQSPLKLPLVWTEKRLIHSFNFSTLSYLFVAIRQCSVGNSRSWYKPRNPCVFLFHFPARLSSFCTSSNMERSKWKAHWSPLKEASPAQHTLMKQLLTEKSFLVNLCKLCFEVYNTLVQILAKLSLCLVHLHDTHSRQIHVTPPTRK